MLLSLYEQHEKSRRPDLNRQHLWAHSLDADCKGLCSSRLQGLRPRLGKPHARDTRRQLALVLVPDRPASPRTRKGRGFWGMTTYRAAFIPSGPDNGEVALTGPEHAHLSDDELRAEALKEAHQGDVIAWVDSDGGRLFPTEEIFLDAIVIGDWTA